MSQQQALSLEDVNSRVIFSDYLSVSQIIHLKQNGDYLSPTVFRRRTGPLINEVSTVDNRHG